MGATCSGGLRQRIWTMQRFVVRVLALVLLVSLAACEGRRDEERVTYEVKGKVVRVEAARRTIVIHHEAIPGFMEEMTMPFDVRDPAILEGLHKGEAVRFELVVQGTHAWIARFLPAPGGS